MRHLLIGFFIYILSTFITASDVQAQILINEVHPAPSTGNEWIELTNSSDVSVPLQGWRLEDQLTTPSVIFSFTTEQLPAHTFLIVEVTNKLNNSGDGVTLYNSLSQIIDQMSYTSSQSNQSWARNPDITGTFVLTAPTRGTQNFTPTPQPSPTPSPSPVSSPSPDPVVSPSPSASILPSPSALIVSPTPIVNSSPTPISQPSPTPTITYPQYLKISEIMACPETGEHEWFEIYNPDTQPATLQNWKVKDGSTNSRVVSIEIPAQQFVVFTFSSNILNNDGDQLRLERPDGVQVDQAEFGACQKGRSFIFYQGEWQETTTITPGLANIYTPLLNLLDQDIDTLSETTTMDPPAATEEESNIQSESTTKTSVSKKKAKMPSPKAKIKATTKKASEKAAVESGDPVPVVLGDSGTSDPLPFFSKYPQFKPYKNALVLLFLSSITCLLLSAWYFKKWHQWYTDKYVENDFTFS